MLPVVFLALLLGTRGSAQSEIEWDVTLNTDQITQTDKSQLQALERDLVTFLNGQTWTNDRFQEDERIQAIMFLTLREQVQESNKGSGAAVPIPNAFTGTLAIQTVRPIYGVPDVTPIFNTQDKNITFTYRQGEGILFSEQTYLSNLGSIMAFYCYIVLGLDYDTFSPMGGEKYFLKAQEVYNLLPANLTQISKGDKGWRPTERARNRYTLMNDILNPQMLPMRRAYYTYHRLGLDLMSTDIVSGRNNVTLAIEDAQKANASNPNSVYAQAFTDAKRQEIIEIYKGATGVEQNTVITAMSRIDPAKSSAYRAIRYKGPRRAPRSPSRAPSTRNRGGVQ
ncbi:hypothetical protein A3850_008430 [Lewinella sp. 4G2]|nr:hypothetical protein A3850_008430 [Lewinella sp. 4G2]